MRNDHNPELTIALDAMGGDKAPNVVVEGAGLARTRYPKVRFMIYGDRAALEPLLARRPKLASDPLQGIANMLTLLTGYHVVEQRDRCP